MLQTKIEMLSKSVYLNDVCQARALVGVQVVVQSLTQPAAQHLHLTRVPLLQTIHTTSHHLFIIIVIIIIINTSR